MLQPGTSVFTAVFKIMGEQTIITGKQAINTVKQVIILGEQGIIIAELQGNKL